MIVITVILIALAVILTLVVRVAGWRFTVQRMAGAALIVVLVTFTTTWLLRQTPGDPCLTALGTGATEEGVEACRIDRALDEGVVRQYANWVGDVLTGDLGYAQYRTQIPLTRVLKDRAGRTGLLFLYSQLLALGFAVPMGVWSAYQANRPSRPFPKWILPTAVVGGVAVGFALGWTLAAIGLFGVVVPIYLINGIRGGPGADNAVNITAFVLLSIPVFVIGESLRYIFAIQHDWYDLVGYSPLSDGIVAHAKSVWLPALVLGLAVSPVYLRLLRADMIQNLQQDFVAVAKAKGMSNTHVLLRHVLRPSTVTLLTVAGLNIAQIVNGAVVVEFIYDFDGMGSYLLEAVAAREFFPVQTLVAMVAVLFVLANTVVDVVYTTIDPRVRADADK